MSFTSRLPLPWALLASGAVHALLVAVWSAQSRATPAPEVSTLTRDAWAASSVEVGTVASETREASAESEPETPVAPSPAAPTEPAEPTPAPEPKAPTRPTPRARTEVLPPRDAFLPQSAASSPPMARPSSATPLASAPPPAPSANAALASAGSEPAQPSSAGSLGTLGLPPGVRHLAKAFARALPEGGHRDRSWSELPLGPAGRAVLTIHVDTEGHIEKAELDPEIPTPAPLRRMIERTTLMLKSGTFSLDKKSVSAGVERLSVEVTLSEEAAAADDLAAPHLMAKEGHQAPERERAGYARFTLNSGRHMEAVLRLLAP